MVGDSVKYLFFTLVLGVLLGFSDLSNFIRAFRRWTGKSPTAFRGAGRALAKHANQVV